MKRLLKFLHEVGSVGVMGAFATCLVLELTGPAQPDAAFLASRHAIAAVTHWLLMPSLLLVTISGLLAIAANRALMNAGWAWVKALTGISLFEGSLLTVGSTAREAGTLAGAGPIDPVAMAHLLRSERNGLWLLLAICVANIVLAVWRPRLLRLPVRD